MTDTRINYISKPELDEPILLEGLPGIGHVGKLAVEHIIEELGAEKFAELYSDYFPHHILIDSDGILHSVKNEFYFMKLGDKDVIVLVGDAQATESEGHYQVTRKILDLAEEFNVDQIITLGGLATGRYSKEESRVIGVVNQPELLDKFHELGISIEEESGPIVGVSGLLLGMSKLRGIKGICLLGETHGMLVDHRSAQSVLNILSKILDFSIDTTTLSDRAKKTEEIIRKIREEERLRREKMAREEDKDLSYIG